MELHDYNKVQINYSVKKDKNNTVIERGTLISIRTDNAEEGFMLYQNLRQRLNGELAETHQVSKGTESTDEQCPDCGNTMVIRTAKKGQNAGQQFKACSAFPECRKTLPIPEEVPF